MRISGEDLENIWTLEGNLPTRSVKESDSEGFAEPSAPHTQGRPDAPRCLSSYMVDCVACKDTFQLSELVHCPCGDFYCSECLKSLFVYVTINKTLFPPQCCCQTILLSAIEVELSDVLLSNFNSATIEFSTINRIYCVQTDCEKFILFDHIYSS